MQYVQHSLFCASALQDQGKVDEGKVPEEFLSSCNPHGFTYSTLPSFFTKNLYRLPGAHLLTAQYFLISNSLDTHQSVEGNNYYTSQSANT